MRTYLVTGGAGFIGSHLCETLLQNGCEVIALDSLNDYYDVRIKEKNLQEIRQHCGAQQFQFVHGDIRDMNMLKSIFSRNSIQDVIHLAAYAGVRPSIEEPRLYYDVNVMGTLNILECMKKYHVKKMLFASSSSVYGNNKFVPFSEDHFVDQPISPYAATKKSCELLCHTYHHLYDINIACLRFFTVYGPRQRPDLAIHKFTRLIDEGKPIPFFGDGSTKRDYTYIGDIIDGIMKAAKWVESDEKRFEVFNLGESSTISLKEMVETIEQAIGKKAIIHHMPKQAGDVELTNADISKAKRILGYHPTTKFSDGIAKFVAWYRKNKKE